MQQAVTLRRAGADDEAILFRLFCSAHEGTFASLDMSAERKEQLLTMQFDAQQQQYGHRYPDADFDMVLNDGAAIGNFYAQRGPDEYVFIDITLLPEHRNAGIGTALVRELIAQAHADDKPLHAHVLKQNPAWRLWQRLGFRQVSDDGVYLQIEVPADNLSNG